MKMIVPFDKRFTGIALASGIKNAPSMKERALSQSLGGKGFILAG